MKLFINYTNHPSTKWSKEQIDAAKFLADKIIDIPFPNVDPSLDEDGIISLVEAEMKKMEGVISNENEIIIHIAGEPTFVAYFVSHCNKWCPNIACLTSTTKRDVVENEDGTKTVKFNFVRFRQYITA